MTKNDNTGRGITPDPAETSRDSQQHQQTAIEGDYRNAEKSADQASYLEDDYESRKRNAVEKENKSGAAS